jgi:hypothetical protein
MIKRKKKKRKEVFRLWRCENVLAYQGAIYSHVSLRFSFPEIVIEMRFVIVLLGLSDSPT